MFNEEIPLQQLQNEYLNSKNLNLYVLRLDLIHPQISGNKWFKLKYNLEKARNENYSTILTFGGAYSNHIVATAAACKNMRFKSIGIIRGEKSEPLNERLAFATSCGMQIEYISRTEYRLKQEDSFIEELKKKYGNIYIIPEGGSNELAVKGCTEIMQLARNAFSHSFKENSNFDYICCACGTGSTLKGILHSLEDNEKVIGIPVLKNADALKTELNDTIIKFNRKELENKFQILNGYEFGGYAKTTKELDDFITRFNADFSIDIEFVYTGKLFYAVFDLIKKDYFKSGQNIVVIHTGGVFNING